MMKTAQTVFLSFDEHVSQILNTIRETPPILHEGFDASDMWGFLGAVVSKALEVPNYIEKTIEFSEDRFKAQTK